VTNSTPGHGPGSGAADLAASGRALPWHRRHKRILGVAGALLASGMTILWLVVVPEGAESTQGLRSWVLRLGHPAAWACLAGVGIAVAADAPRPLRPALAWAALGSYGAFVLALVL
jgi:hypothetical protein